MAFQNKWRAIRAFYREAEPDILEAGANEWGIDPYLWDVPGIMRFTPIERLLWYDIRACDAVLYPQYPVLRFFVDFANPAAKVAIECDGKDWHDADKDAARDKELREAGWCVYRFPGWMCCEDSDPETGAPAEAYKRMKHICDVHGISRFDRAWSRSDKPKAGDDLAEWIYRAIQRDNAILDAARRYA